MWLLLPVHRSAVDPVRCLRLTSIATHWRQTALQGGSRLSVPRSAELALHVRMQDWPHKWPSFIPDIVGASKNSETLCENSMVRGLTFNSAYTVSP